MTIWDYLMDRYRKSGGWQFIIAGDVFDVFGLEEGKIGLNMLIKEGKIKKRQGFNVALVEIIKPDGEGQN
jgi:hypothetical protein